MQVEITVTLEEELNGATRKWTFSESLDGERAEEVAYGLMHQFFDELAREREVVSA